MRILESTLSYCPKMADGEDSVHVSHPHEGITMIAIDRKHRRNAVNAATARKLYDAVTAFEADPAQKVFVDALISSILPTDRMSRSRSYTAKMAHSAPASIFTP